MLKFAKQSEVWWDFSSAMTERWKKLKTSNLFSLFIVSSNRNRSDLVCELLCNAPVICIPGSLGAGDTGDIAGLKCRNLTSEVSRQSRGCAGVLTSH